MRDLHSTNFTELNSHHIECHQNYSAKHCRWLDFHGTHTGLTTSTLNIRITICTNIRWEAQNMQTLITQSSPLPFHLVSLKPNIFFSTLFSNTVSLYSSLNVRDTVKEIKQYQKKWLQHVQRMDTNRLPKQALQYKPKGRRNVGRPRKRWRDQLHLEVQGTRNTPKPSWTWWWCERRSFKPIQNNGQHYGSVHFNLYVSGYKLEDKRIWTKRWQASPPVPSAVNLFMNGILIC